jgi:hypothetical protein
MAHRSLSYDRRMADVDGRAADEGVDVIRGGVPAMAVDAALRHIHRDIVRRGMTEEQISEWIWSAHWFPHLKWDEEILALLEHVPGELRDGELCDPQIVLHMPDGDEYPLEPHVDRAPEWANERGYRRIVGIALSPGRCEHGGLLVWPFGKDGPEPVEVDPGDVVVMHPALPHTSGFNRTGTIRYAVYFRFLEPV